MAVIKTDTFTEGSDTPLENHISDSGGGWSGWNTTRIDVIASVDEITDDGTDTTQQWALGDESPGNADYECSVNGNADVASGTFWFGALVRGNGVNQDAYYVWLNGGGTARIFKIVAGVITQLGSDYISGIAASTNADIKIKAIGTAITGYVNGVERFSITDNSITAVGRLGITLRRGADITSLNADDLVAVGAGNPWNYYAQQH